MRAKLLLAAVGLFAGSWGLGWGLPRKDRILRVLPAAAETAAFRKAMTDSWNALHRRLGEDIILNPDVYSPGFAQSAVVEPGWETPPELLMNSARSFHLRSSYEDEANILRGVATLKPWPLQLNPRVYFYGNSYIFLLAAWIGASSLVTPVTLVGGIPYYLEHVDKMALIFLSGRALSVFIYLLCGAFLIAAGRRHFSERAGLIAAGLFLVSPAMAYQAHYMKPHLLGNLFILAAFWLSVEMLESGNTRRGILAGAAVGLAAAAAIHLSAAVLIVVAAFALRLKEGKGFKTEMRWAAASAAAFFAAFLVVNSYFLTETTTTLNALGRVSNFLHLNPLKILRFCFIGLPLALTPPIFACFAFGLLSPGTRASAAGRLGLLSVSALLISSILFPTVALFDCIRYFGGSLIGFLLAGAAIEKGRPWVKGLAAAAFLYGLTATSVMDYNLHLDSTDRSTKFLAGEWIEREIPAGSELCLLRLPQPSNAPYFQWNRYRLRFVEPERVGELDRGDLPEFVVLTHAAGDDGPNFAPIADAYEKIKSFEPFSWGWFRFPTGQVQGNAPVEIFRRSQARSNTAAAKRITQGIAESL